MTHHIIYIPGLGDQRTYGQHVAINLWRCFGFTPHYFPLGWNKKEGFNAKLERILQRVEQLSGDANHVSLVGVSAGASAVINAYVSSKKVTGVVSISGKINHPETVKPSVYATNPDFKESLEMLQNSLGLLTGKDKQRLLSIHPLKDLTVPLDDTRIPGVEEKTVIGWNHVQGIAAGVVMGSAAIARFLHETEGAEKA